MVLLAGENPTGNGGNLAGFGDQRDLWKKEIAFLGLIQSSQDEVLGRSHSAKRIADEYAVLAGHKFRDVSLTQEANLFVGLGDVHSTEEEKRQVRSGDK